jgi:hypothetical protein
MAKTHFFAKVKRKQDRSLIRFVELLFVLFELIGLPKYKSKYSKVNIVKNNVQMANKAKEHLERWVGRL